MFIDCNGCHHLSYCFAHKKWKKTFKNIQWTIENTLYETDNRECLEDVICLGEFPNNQMELTDVGLSSIVMWFYS